MKTLDESKTSVLKKALVLFDILLSLGLVILLMAPFTEKKCLNEVRMLFSITVWILVSAKIILSSYQVRLYRQTAILAVYPRKDWKWNWGWRGVAFASGVLLSIAHPAVFYVLDPSCGVACCMIKYSVALLVVIPVAKMIGSGLAGLAYTDQLDYPNYGDFFLPLRNVC